MKKILALFLIVLILITPLSLNFASAEGEISDVQNTEFSVEFLKEFVGNYPNRLSGTQGEKDAAKFIAGKFQELVDESGYIPYAINAENEEKFYQKFSFTDNDVSKNSQNIIVTKPAFTKSDKTVIIGAHYDNAYMVPESTNKDDYKLQGAYDNGTGVAIMMDLANKLKDVDLNFNVTFIAFGAEEYLLKGSEYYAEKLTEKNLSDILIMFNLDVIGAGDKLYLYCDEVKTEHEQFILDTAKSKDIELNSPPLDKHVKLYALPGMPYMHTGFMSDNLSFLTKGVNCAFFFTYNWEYGLAESDKYPTMIHSTNDNMDFLNEKYAKTYKGFMGNVSDIILSSIKAEGFQEKMVLSLDNKFDYRPFLNNNMILIVAVIILTLAGVLVVLTYFNLNKNKKLPEIIDNPADKIDDSVFGQDFEDDTFK